MNGHVICAGKTNIYKFVRKPEGKKPIRRSRQEDNSQVSFKETGCEFEDWIHLAEDKLQ
jgi:hypothetical protein